MQMGKLRFREEVTVQIPGELVRGLQCTSLVVWDPRATAFQLLHPSEHSLELMEDQDKVVYPEARPCCV